MNSLTHLTGMSIGFDNMSNITCEKTNVPYNIPILSYKRNLLIIV